MNFVFLPKLLLEKFSLLSYLYPIFSQAQHGGFEIWVYLGVRMGNEIKEIVT